MTLDISAARCLGKTEAGKPSGCYKADRCLRHVALRYDPPGAAMLVNDRMCGAEQGIHAFFIHVDTFEQTNER